MRTLLTRHRLRTAVAATAATTLLVACGSSSDSDDASSSADNGGDSSSESSDPFPVTVEHAFGETTVEAEPERVAAVAWANHEVPLALGIVPVGMSKATWGDDNGNGILPWVEDQLAELDAETPVLFDETEGIDFEAVADTQPDVILAAYSGITQEEYDTLSKIAPTIAYPEIPWSTSMEEMIELDSEGLGLEAEGETLEEDLESEIDAAFDERPDLAGKSVMFAYLDPNDLSKIGFYTTHDPRTGFLADVGMEMPAVVEEASDTSEEFYSEISAEEADQLNDVDIIVTYGTDTTLAQVQADPLLSKIPAVANGSVAVLEDSTPLAASSNPSPLSIGWGIGDYFDLLNEAAGTGAGSTNG